MRKGINVLSLFGGIECGRMALDSLGIPIANYFSAEVDKYPIMCSSHNFPDIKHLGSVTDVHYQHTPWGYGFCRKHDMTRCNEIDLLIGGPPCQDLSIAGKRAGLEGARSGLFYEYVRILLETRPKYFFMENVASMPKEAREEITSQLFGIEPMMVNAALVSAQNRKRLYWVGKRNEDGTYSRLEVPQPEDRGIILRDILEDIPFSDPRWKPLREEFIEKVKEKEKAFAVTATYAGACPQDHIRSNRTILVANVHPSGKGMNGNLYHPDGKAPTVTTNKGEGSKILGIYQVPRGKNNGGIVCDGEKSPTLSKSEWEHNNLVVGQFRRSDLRVHSEQEKVCTLTANMGTGGNNVPIVMGMAHRNRGEGKKPEFSGEEKANSLTTVLSDSEVVVGSPMYLWRKLTVRECARLQTIPDSYDFSVLSDSRAYKGIGNGWPVEVPKHFFSYMDLGQGLEIYETRIMSDVIRGAIEVCDDEPYDPRLDDSDMSGSSNEDR